MNSSKQSYYISRGVILLSVLIAVAIGCAVWDINPWPTDAEAYYMPAALRIPYAQYLSDIHATEGIEKVRWLHGKEFYIAAISLFQFLMNDFETLRPLMLIGLIGVAISAILVFYISRRYWGEWVGLLCYLSFVFCLWPYVYILFAKHQTLGLMFFLISVAVMLNFSKMQYRYVWPFLSGLFIGLACFSSTVSSLFLPFYAVGMYRAVRTTENRDRLARVKAFLGTGFLAGAGFLLVFFYVNLPDILLNIENFKDYVHISGKFNHFYYNQIYLQQWFPHSNVGAVRAGWIWILKYLFLILPVLFPLYLTAVGYLLWLIFKTKNLHQRLKFLGIIGLSLVPAIMAEIVQVAQYGANYFPLLIGILIVLGYSANEIRKRISFKHPAVKQFLYPVMAGIFILHAGINTFLFIDDVFIPRMATTFLSRKIESLGIDRLATYRSHFHRNYFVYCLDSHLRERMGWVGIQSLGQLDRGYALVPPVTGDSIYVAASTSYANYDKDPVLVQLVRRHLLKDCAVASFRTMINSRIWQNEEEILSYRSLILGHHLPADVLGRVWIIDEKKVKALGPKLLPTPDEYKLMQEEFKNIGTVEKFYIFEGQRIGIQKPTQVHHIVSRIWKIGDPQDSLILSIYKTDPFEPIWLPVGKSFTSEPLHASRIQTQSDRSVNFFTLAQPLELERGVYYIVVYRTGRPDDQNYYQIDQKRFAIQ